MIKFRLATMDDAARLFAWRNDPDTAAASLHDAPLSFAKHCEWLAQKLADFEHSESPSTLLVIAHDVERSVTVGMLRIDYTDSEAVVSIAVDPKQRGRGYAQEILTDAITTANATDRAVPLVAYVKEKNYASLRLFWANGFRDVSAKDGVLKLVRTWN